MKKMIALFLFVWCSLLSSCAIINAKAGPTGKLESLSYYVFLRQYDASLEETADGVKVTIGAKSELDGVVTLIKAGMVLGAKAALP